MRDTCGRSPDPRRPSAGGSRAAEPALVALALILGLATPVRLTAQSKVAADVPLTAPVECPGQTDPALSGLAGRVLEAGQGVGIPGALVLATWNDDAHLRQTASVETGDAGVYVLCGLPTLRTLTIQAAFAEFASEPLTVAIEPGPPAGWDFEVAAAAGSASGDSRFPARIVGHVIDRRSGRPVESATVSLGPELGSQLSDGNGRFTLQGLTPGVYRVEISHLAYEPVEQLVNLPASQTVEMRFELSADPIELEPLVVTAVRERRLETQGFYERKEISERLGNGVFFTREDIRRANPIRVSHLLGQVPGIRLECQGMGNNCMIKMTGGSPSLSNRAEYGCVNANVYIDGVHVLRDNQGSPEPLDNFVIPSEVAAIEVYRGASEIPAEFGGSTGRCGAIVIWTGSGG